MTTPFPSLFAADHWEGLLVCPDCQLPVTVASDGDVVCGKCHGRFPRLASGWDLLPRTTKPPSDLWPTWERVQTNGVASYTSDPEHNLGVGPRRDYLSFGEFCRYDGDVLDIGCGPQPWPTHFTAYSARTRFIGIDPLVGEQPAEYAQIRALAERLPFRSASFDHVVFATSMDHFVDPLAPLVEAARVCRPEGEVDVWLGEKSPDAPRPATSPQWYQSLVKPERAEDVFHIKRLTTDEFRALANRAGLTVVEEDIRIVDDYRRNYYGRLRRSRA